MVVDIILWMIAMYLAMGLTATFFGTYLIVKGIINIKGRKKNENQT
jgi:uncharacterized membrane protein HdeD (DUF308 family)